MKQRRTKGRPPSFGLAADGERPVGYIPRIRSVSCRTAGADQRHKPLSARKVPTESTSFPQAGRRENSAKSPWCRQFSPDFYPQDVQNVETTIAKGLAALLTAGLWSFYAASGGAKSTSQRKCAGGNPRASATGGDVIPTLSTGPSQVLHRGAVESVENWGRGSELAEKGPIFRMHLGVRNRLNRRSRRSTRPPQGRRFRSASQIGIIICEGKSPAGERGGEGHQADGARWDVFDRAGRQNYNQLGS